MDPNQQPPMDGQPMDGEMPDDGQPDGQQEHVPMEMVDPAQQEHMMQMQYAAAAEQNMDPAML